MVIYTKETKTLIIPEGLGNLQSGNCDGVYREGFDDGYSSGYTSGHTDGYQEGLAADCGEAIETAYDNGYGDGYTSGTTDGYNDGYGDGYAQGQEDCSGSSCELMIGTVDLENGDSGQWIRNPDEGYDGFRQVRIYDRGYGQGKYDQGYQDGLANCPECPTVDCTSAVTEAYQEGYDAGVADCSGQSCSLQAKSIEVTQDEGVYTPDTGYDGFSEVHVDASSYGSDKYDEGFNDGFLSGASTTDCSQAAAEAYEIGFSSGYSAGLEDCPECDCTSAVTAAYEEGYTSGNTDGFADGYESGTTDGFNAGYTSGNTDGFNSGYTSGATDGYASGRQSGYTDGYGAGFGDGYSAGQADCQECDCTSAVTAAYNDGYASGSTDGYQSGYTAGLDNNLNFVINISNWQGPHNEIREIKLNGETYNCITDTNEWGAIKFYGETTESAITSLSFEVYTVYLEIQSAVTINGTVFSAESVTVESLDEGLFVAWHRCTIDFDNIPMYEIEPSAVTEAYQEGYQSGVTDTFPIAYQSGSTDTWPIAYQSGYTDGLANCPSCDCTSAFTEGYTSGYTDGRAATGTDRTYAIEVTFATENSYFASVSGAHIDVTTLVHPDDYLVGTAKPSFFDYTYFNEDYDYQNNIATYQFVGQWRYGSPSGQVQGNVTPVDLFMWISKANIQNWGDFHCTKVRFNPNVTIENGVAVFEPETGFEYIPVWTDDDGVPTATDNRFLDIQIEWNQDLYCASAVTEAFEEGQGTVGTIEFTFEGDLPTVGWDTNPVITAEMYSGNTYVGQYNFDYSMDGYDITSESLSQGTKAVKSFVGTFKKQGGLPRSSKYMDIRYIGIDVPSAYLADWSNWTLTIRVNGRPQYIYCPGPVICGLNKIRPGGFKLRTLSIDTTQPGYTPNTTHVIANL